MIIRSGKIKEKCRENQQGYVGLLVESEDPSSQNSRVVNNRLAHRLLLVCQLLLANRINS